MIDNDVTADPYATHVIVRFVDGSIFELVDDKASIMWESMNKTSFFQLRKADKNENSYLKR